MVNSTVNSSILTFFVPGIMGSSLILRKADNPSLLKDKEIWGENLGINISVLRQNPSLLAIQENKPVEAVKVIERFRYIPENLGNVYGSFCDFIRDPDKLGLTENLNFFPFAYDWRQDNQLSAERLAEFVRSKDPKETHNYRFIVHSMGGIVTRLMLLNNNNSEILERTDLLFQMASPIAGSTKAYYTLKKRPNFNPIFDLLCQGLQNGDKVAQLRVTLMGFPSVYQLLPPPEIKCLCDHRNDKLYSALDDTIWQEHFRNNVQTARQVHEQLRNSESLNNKIRIICVAGTGHKTPKRYLIDHLQDFNLIAQEVGLIRRIGYNRVNYPLSGDGDDTVTLSSAIAYTLHRPENEIDSEPASHMTLCNHPIVHEMLKQEFSR